MMNIKLYLCFVAHIFSFHVVLVTSAANQCVPVLNNKCTSELGSYNLTRFPNALGHSDYTASDGEFHQFLNLIDSSCSPSLLPFLCSAFYPKCDPLTSTVLPPCATECVKSLSQCSFLFTFYGFNWPSNLSCDRFSDGSHCPQPGVSTCSTDVKKYTEKPCLEYTKKAATNTSTYWFGTNYNAVCPKGSATSFNCTNSRQGTADSIASRLQLDLSQLDRTVNITYTHGEGSYQSCGSKFRVWNGNYIEVQPGDGVYKAYDVHQFPRIQWHAAKSELDSLIVYDVGNLYVHGIYVNIVHGEISSGQVLKSYLHPIPPQTEPNPFAFLVFKQSSSLSVSDATKQMLLQTTDLAAITKTLELTGPVALNWINVVRDPYAIEGLVDLHIADLCPYLETGALLKHNRSFIHSDTFLDVALSVTFNPSATTYTSCCSTHTVTAKKVTLKSLAPTYVDTADVRTEAAPTINFYKAGLISLNRVTDTYTLICIDPDVSKSHSPIIHWMVTNIPDGNIQNGQTVLPYIGPMPPPGKNHTYYFLLYKQSSPVDASTVDGYAGPHCQGRCLFDINRFVADNHMTLSGALWMIAHNDAYIRHLYVTQRGMDEHAVCHGVSGYSANCHESVVIVG
uniref:FZ domain-containing protein n=2 Tax=Magallana gigas TaxID=29159 RepID=A0A8W8JZ87_MAGGI|nr:uncharacterized protein C56G2.4 [Crassostrea gigas]